MTNYNALAKQVFSRRIESEEILPEIVRCIDALIESDNAKRLLYDKFSDSATLDSSHAREIVATTISLLRVSHLYDIIVESADEDEILAKLRKYKPTPKCAHPGKIERRSAKSSGFIPRATKCYFGASRSSFGRNAGS